MASVLGAGNDSRLVKDLVGARHLVTEISASNGGPGFRYDNLLGFSAVPAGSHSLEEVETAIDPVPTRPIDRAPRGHPKLTRPASSTRICA
jgi:predicted Zn-dependent peptidase